MHHNQSPVGKPTITNIPSSKSLQVVSGNEQVTLTCEVTGDNITGGYWERRKSGPLPMGSNMSSLSNDKSILKMIITRVRPEHSGKYRCVAYSQWGVGQSRNVQVTITSESNNVSYMHKFSRYVNFEDVTNSALFDYIFEDHQAC